MNKQQWAGLGLALLALAGPAPASEDEQAFLREAKRRSPVASERQLAGMWQYHALPEGQHPLRGRALHAQLCDYKGHYEQKLMSYCHIALQEAYRSQYPLAFLAGYQPSPEPRRFELPQGRAWVVDISSRVSDRARHVPAVLRVRLEQDSGASKDLVLLWFAADWWAFVL
ncbi:hypothetical protein [Chitinilyticum litopenaei]|uniref:hypothetical protein n=1 Tax=Chitinilyticum litopenaei TaxID=1121276 RepID=UPI000419BB03|nr:hypothetical protein [Chitinilyticum litopenaei]